LLSNADFDSGRATKLARETGAHLFRFSDEAGVLIRLFVMKFSIADALNAECGMRNADYLITDCQVAKRLSIRIPHSAFLNQ
jgi:hypothetical protein